MITAQWRIVLNAIAPALIPRFCRFAQWDNKVGFRQDFAKIVNLLGWEREIPRGTGSEKTGGLHRVWKLVLISSVFCGPRVTLHDIMFGIVENRGEN